MATIIEMPKLSDTMTEGTLLKWLKKTGDAVDVGDELAEIETDKATMSLDAFDEGVLHEIYVKEGEKVPLGERLALLLEEGETPPEPGDEPSSSAPESDEDSGNEEEKSDSPKAAKKPDDQPKSTSEKGDSSEPASSRQGKGDRVKASPLARRMAAERDIDLAQLEGTGPGGRIVKRDVEEARVSAKRTGEAGTAAPPAAKMIRASAGEGDERIRLSGMRSVIAERLLASKTQIPHFYLTFEVDAAPLLAFRREVNSASEKEKSDSSNKYTINDFILKAVALSAVAVPEVNASFDGDAIIRFASVHLSVAVAIDDGLVTPVIRDAQKRSLLEISRAVKDLAARAREKKLSPDEFTGGTLTVSNLGAFGVESFDAIINPPQACIIAVSAIRKTPVVDANDQIVVGQRIKIGLSGDHRVVDGAVGARYLGEVRRLIESPALMLL